MPVSRWRRQADPQLAADELLDAAALAFRDLGVAKATMVDVCRYAGCSRATLYRYFPSQHELHLAFVNRATIRIAARAAAARSGADTPPDVELADRILGGVQAVRSDPLLSVWYESENVHVPLALSRDSEALRRTSTALIADLCPSELTEAELDRRAEWMLRCIASLLAQPASDPGTERALVEELVVPALLGEPRPTGPAAGTERGRPQIAR